MKVCFSGNTTLIDRVHALPLGSLTCELLNAQAWKEHRLLGAQLDFFVPAEGTTAAEFLAGIDATQASVDRMRAALTKNRYYQINNEAANTFASVEELLNNTRCQIKQKMSGTGNESVFELDIEIDLASLTEASMYFDSLYKVQGEAVDMFSKLVDTIMIQNEAFPQRRPIERLQAYGFERFQKDVHELVQEVKTASSSTYTPDFEMFTLENGTVKMALAIGINNVAQLMYHEIMNLIMQGHSIRKCKNCGKYFVQYGDRVVDYCDEIPDGETKSCKMIGSSRQFTASLKDDPIKLTYTRVYKKYVARRRLRTVSESQFAEWSVEARKLRSAAYKTNMAAEIFREKLDELMMKITGEI